MQHTHQPITQKGGKMDKKASLSDKILDISEHDVFSYISVVILGTLIFLATIFSIVSLINYYDAWTLLVLVIIVVGLSVWKIYSTYTKIKGE